MHRQPLPYRKLSRKTLSASLSSADAIKRGPAPQLLRPSGAIDTRTPTTLWHLLIWAYWREQVRFAGARAGESLDWRDLSATGSVCRALETGIAGRGGERGTINGRPSAHPDADAVHACVSALPRDRAWQVIKAAESGRLPTWEPPEEPPLQVRPVMSQRGPKMLICPKKQRVIGCLIEVVGISEEERRERIAAARLGYLEWLVCLDWIMFDLMTDDELSRWRITEIGVPCEPWSTAA